VLILDEPTSSLDDKEVAMLFKLMRELKGRGVGIIFVTHFLEQVYEVCDRITVLRNGELVGEYAIEDLPQVELVAKMMGKDLNDLESLGQVGHKSTGADEVVYEAGGLSSSEARPFDFKIRRGEVNGFTGLLGSGRSESVRAIFGADRVTGGRVRVKGREVKITNPREAMKNGIGYLPEDRKRDGIIADLSVRENIILALQVMKGFFHPMSKGQMRQFADEYIKALQIKTASQDTPIKSLSGGNQQKVLIGRWLANNPDVLILDEPTRGIDVGAKYEIYCIIEELARQGKSIIMISSEMAELIGMSDRIMVMCDGRVTGFIDGKDATQENIMELAARFETV
jgi:simple sugar transport system ATP-binding protein